MCAASQLKMLLSVLVIMLLLLAQTSQAADECKSFENSVTHKKVHPASWEQILFYANDSDASLPPLLMEFNWCTKAQTNWTHTSACSKPGYVQLFQDGKCHLNCDAWVQGPQMFSQQGQNLVTMLYDCFPEDGSPSIIFEVRMACCSAQNETSDVGYQLQGGLLSTTLCLEMGCGGPSIYDYVAPPLSTGAVFLILLVIGFAVYIIATVVFNAVKGRRGKELIPHRDFWADLPVLVKDGCVFTFSKARGLCNRGDAGGSSPEEVA